MTIYTNRFITMSWHNGHWTWAMGIQRMIFLATEQASERLLETERGIRVAATKRNKHLRQYLQKMKSAIRSHCRGLHFDQPITALNIQRINSYIWIRLHKTAFYTFRCCRAHSLSLSPSHSLPIPVNYIRSHHRRFNVRRTQSEYVPSALKVHTN